MQHFKHTTARCLLVKLRYKDKVARCRILVVLCDSPALLGMLDTELSGILKIICEVVEDQQAGKKLDL